MKTNFVLGILLFSSICLGELADRVVSVVNNEIITLSDLRAFSEKLDKGQMIDDLLLFDKKQESLKGDTNAQRDYLINERVLESEVKRLNLSVTLERVEQEIRDIAKKNGVPRSELLNAIKAQGMTTSEYQSFLKARIERQSLIEQEVSSKIRIADEDVLASYARSNPKAQGGVYEFNLAHIFFNTKKSGVEAAQDRARAALKRIREGAPFELVAEQTSEDPQFSNGGQLGTFRSGELSPELEAAFGGLSSGGISDVAQAKDGIHIFKVLGKKLSTDPQFEKEREKIRAQLFESSFQKQLKAWLELKREEAFIRINQ